MPLSDAPDRAKALYDLVKDNPNADPAGMTKLIALRNVVPELLMEIRVLRNSVQLARA